MGGKTVEHDRWDTHSTWDAPIMTASGKGEKTGGAAVEGLKGRAKKSYRLCLSVGGFVNVGCVCRCVYLRLLIRFGRVVDSLV